MRLFVALDIPADIRQRLARLKTADGLKWVKPENLHITLKFIGEAEPEGIAEALASVDFPAPIDIAVEGIGSFPNALFARLRLSVPDSLTTLATAIETVLLPLGIRKESRPFTPHLTLARRKDGPRIRVDPATASENFRHFAASEFILYQSLLSKVGPTYNALRRFPCLKS